MLHLSELEKTITDELQMYAEKEYTSQLISAMLSKDVSAYISIAVDSMSLFESNIAFAHYMFRNPRNALKLLDNAFQKVALYISKSHILKADMTYNENLHVRLVALPNLPEVYRSNLPSCSDVGQFLCINGAVIRASAAKMLQYKKLWRCSKCKYQFIVEAVAEQGYISEKPMRCSNPDWCNGKNFTLMSSDINTEWCKDYQEIKLQEQVYNLNVGTVPKSMWVVLEDDLVESCHAGNDVIVSGILIQRWKPLFKGSLIDIELVILAHNVEVQNKMSSGVVSKDMAQEFGQFWQEHKSHPLKGRNVILSSICPQVFGLYIVKLAVALVLAGGVQKKDRNSRIRGDSHLLLIGDPGTAKSQFLKFASKVSSRSVLTSGIGTTNAGLTVSAIKESGRWQLEAGALVLADGGICCIDEFSCIKEQDKTCIHEAMEQQTISVAKAGLVCSLNTRCSILAATNPKGKYDENMSISENTALGSPLLSRFDIILVLLDTYDEKWDYMVSDYILNGRNFADGNNEMLWSLAKMKNYFALIRHINPRVTPEAERVLQAYFTRQRSMQSRNASRTTPRLLQSLIRLAEGHARLMFRTKVLVMDAVIAIILMESSMLGHSIMEGLSPLHTVFPTDPKAEYEERAQTVLHNLNINLCVDEDFGAFYKEPSIRKLLCDISAVWVSKENPYIFNNCQNADSSDVSALHESSISKTKKTLRDFSNSACIPAEEEFFPKNLQTSTQNDGDLSPVHQIVVEAEIHQNINCEPEGVIFTKQNTIPSTTIEASSKDSCNERFRQENVECDKSNKFSKTIYTSNVENLSILNQILEEPELHSDGYTEPTSGNNNELKDQLSTLSDIKNIFNTKISQTVSNNKSKTGPENYIVNTQFERDDFSILEELGISPEKDLEGKKQTNCGNSHRENFQTNSFSNDKLGSTSNCFPAKRSLTDHLKSFAFSRSRFDSNCNFQNDNHILINSQSRKDSLLDHSFKVPSSKKQKFSGYLRIMDEIQEMDTDKKHCNEVASNFKNNKNGDLVNDFHTHHPKPPKLMKIDQNNTESNVSDVFQNALCENIGKNIPCKVPKVAQHFETETFTSKCLSKEPAIPGPSVPTIKKPLSDNLKKFLFTKKATSSKISRTTNIINEDNNSNCSKT